MRIHYFQHVPEEGLGSIESWARSRGHLLYATRFYLAEKLPQAESADMLVIMGGPMSVNDEAEYLWLKEELAFTREAIASGIPVLGICLGAQLIAKALGGSVFPNRAKEIGWFPVTMTAAARQSRLFSFLPAELTVFHWHGETFSLPEGALLLASSAACDHQAFSYGESEHVLALQFHCEMTPEIIAGIEPSSELVEKDFVQSRGTMLAASAHCQELHRTMNTLLDRLSSVPRSPR